MSPCHVERFLDGERFAIEENSNFCVILIKSKTHPRTATSTSAVTRVRERVCQTLSDHGVVVPELHRGEVGLAVEGDAAAALLLTQCVAHHGDGGHGVLGGVEAGVDGDDAPLGVGYIALHVRRLVGFLLQCLAVVEDDVEPLRLRRLQPLEPAGQHRQLTLAPRLVAGAQQVCVVGGDGRDGGRGGCGVADEEVLAKRRVAVHQHPARLERRIGDLDELLGGHPNDAGASEVLVGKVAAEGELGHSDGVAHGASMKLARMPPDVSTSTRFG